VASGAVEAVAPGSRSALPPPLRPARGRQFEAADAPDGRLRACHRDRDVWIASPDGANERRITSDGRAERRIRNGIASRVYGEELGQNTALWWSPDARRLAYYRFDESRVPDYFLPLDQTPLQSTVDVEAYPKAGVDNPVVDVFVHDLETGRTTRIDVRDGRNFDDDVVGHYVYRVGWSPDGRRRMA
jgi:dipeptidyl-peptidase 4